MSLTSINPPVVAFFDSDGNALENGYIYIGTAGQEARGNPISLYWDTALTVPALQPVRTIGGYPSFNGTPARLFCNAAYSITVLDRNQRLIYAKLNATDFFAATAFTDSFTAAQISYLSTATNATITNVQAWLDSFVINGKRDFGLVGDGVTNDTVQFTKFIAAGQGRTLWLPKGTYNIDTRMVMPNGCHLICSGYWDTVIHQLTPTEPQLIPGNNCKISGFRFTGVGPANLATPGVAAIWNDPSAGGVVGQKNIIEGNLFDTSLSTTAIGGNKWIDCWIYNNYINLGVQGEHGIYISGGSTRNWIVNNRIQKAAPRGVSDRGIQIKGTSSSWFVNNFITGAGFNGYGIVSSDVASTELRIQSNRIYELAAGTSTAIAVGKASQDDKMFILDNQISGLHLKGIEISGSIETKVSRNHITASASSGIEAIPAGGLSNAVLTIDGNIIEGVGGNGIRVVNANAKTYLTGNTSISNVGAGITYEAGSSIDGFIKGNTCHGNGKDYVIQVAIPTDIGTPFTPVFTALTEAGAGTLTITAYYFVNGNVITGYIKLFHAGGKTTQSVDGVTFLDPPIALTAQVLEGRMVVSNIDAATAAAGITGHGHILRSSGKFLLPSWGPSPDTRVIWFEYIADRSQPS